MADHRRLYRFRHDPEGLRYRQGQTEPFQPGQDDFGDFGEKGLEALACAVRASASYPVAFAPVSETPLLEEGYRVFPKASADEQPWTWLMDGGVLDNSPFGPVLDEVASRPVDRRYRRVVTYVVPSSGMPEEGTQDVPPPRPAWPSVVSQAIQLPRESDFRSDIEQLEHALRVAAESPLRTLYRRLRQQHTDRNDRLHKLADQLIPEYRRARLAAGAWQARQLVTSGTMRRLLPIPTASEADEPLPVEASYSWLPDQGAKVADVKLREPWAWGLSAAEHVVLMLLRDVQEQLTSEQDEDLMSEGDRRKQVFKQPEALGKKLSRSLARIRALQEAVDARLEAEARPEGATDLSVTALAKRIDSAYQAPDLNVCEQLGLAVKDAANAYEQLHNQHVKNEAALVVEHALVAEVLTRAFAPPWEPTPTPPFTFARIGPDTPSRVPDLAGYNSLGDRKLYGTRVMHFGAFADRSARANDWTWGRLDAADHLVSLILAPDSDPKDKNREILKVQRLILDEEAQQFPWPTPKEPITGGDLTRWMQDRYAELEGEPGQLILRFLGKKEGMQTALGLGNAAFRLGRHALLGLVRRGSGALVARPRRTRGDR